MLTDSTLFLLLTLQTLLGTFLCVLFWSMYRPYREQRFFLWWSLAWSAQALHLLLGLFSVQAAQGGLLRSGLQVLSVVMGYLQLPLLVFGVRAFFQSGLGRISRWKGLIVAGCGLFGLMAFLASKHFAVSPGVAYVIRSLPRQAAMVGAYAFSAFLLWRGWRAERSSAVVIAAVACALMGLAEVRYVLSGANILAAFLWGAPAPFEIAKGRDLFWTIFDAGSSLLLALGMVQLLVERAQCIGERLRASEELFSAAFHAIPDAISLSRVADDIFLQVSEGFTRTTGWSEAEALGKRPANLVLWTDVREVQKLRDTLRREGECTGVELTLRRKDGSTFVGLASARIVSIGGQDLQLTIVRDISARKEMELSLRKASQAMEQSPLTILITNLQGNIEFVNPAFTIVTGYEKEEVLGRNPRFLKSGETAPETYASMWRTISSGGTWEGLFCNRRKDGTTYWEHGRISPICDEFGSITHYVAVKEDITEAREMEKQRQSLERRSQVNQRIEAVGQLAGGVAHDINNMLSIMLAHIDLLTGQVAQDPLVQKRLKAMEDAALRSAEIVRHLLTFARQQITEPQVLDLNAHLEGLRRTLAPLLGEDQVLRPRLEPDLWRVKVDPAQWDQVVMNLVLNARDAMPGGGEITLTTANLELDESFVATHPEAVPGPYVCLAVGDQGVGMTPEQMGRIFEPFFTTKPMGKGTGLGLSTVFGIVKQAGGFITVYSEPEVGSSFRVYLPAVDADLTKPLAPAPESEPLGSGTILVVEDNDLLRECIREVVSRLGYGTHAVESAEQALALLVDPTIQVDLLLTDVIMPGMSGKALRDQALELRPGLPVLYMSGYTADIIARQGVLEQGTDFLQKPFTREAVRQKIRQVLDLR
jgi:PAS domain S-box-containing protein